MYINQVVYKEIGSDEFKERIVSNRVKKYIADLYQRYQADLNMDMEQPIYSYDEMGKYLFKEFQRTDVLKNTEKILFPTWGVSWSMDYAVHEFHWNEMFGFNGTLLDVRDCGSLCVYYAIHIMLKLCRSKLLKNTLISSIENAWLFCKNKTKVHAPEINYVGSFQCENDKKFNSSLEIISCSIINSISTDKIDQQIEHIIHAMLFDYQIKKTDCDVWIRAFKNIIIQSDWKQIYHPMSSGFLYYCVDLLLKNRGDFGRPYIFIVDFDPSRFSIGVILLKRSVC